MPSKIRPIQFRLPWLRRKEGDKADQIAKAVLEHPGIQEQIEGGCCPICKKPFDECDYFKSLDED